MSEFGFNFENYGCAEGSAKDFFTKDNHIYFINRLKQYHSNVIDVDGCNKIMRSNNRQIK